MEKQNKKEDIKEVQRMLIKKDYSVKFLKDLGEWMKKNIETSKEYINKTKFKYFLENLENQGQDKIAVQLESSSDTLRGSDVCKCGRARVLHRFRGRGNCKKFTPYKNQSPNDVCKNCGKSEKEHTPLRKFCEAGKNKKFMLKEKGK